MRGLRRALLQAWPRRLGPQGWRARPVWQGSLVRRPSRELLVLREPQGPGQTMRSQRNQRAGQRGACS